jgi:hypothetical protein
MWGKALNTTIDIPFVRKAYIITLSINSTGRASQTPWRKKYIFLA